MTTNDVSEILDKVNTFYSQSFTTLVAIITAMVGLVGVLIPLVAGWYQNQRLKLEKAELLNVLNDRLKVMETETANRLENKFKQFAGEIENVLNKRFCKLEGIDFAFQARDHADKGAMASAFCNSMLSAVRFLECEHEGNLRTSIALMTRKILPALNRNAIENFTLWDLKKQYEELIKKIQDNETPDYKYKTLLADLKAEYNKSMSR
jgi:hypothetical protein